MKHPLSTTVILLVLFFATQLIGLVLVNKVMPVSVDDAGNTVVSAPDTAIGPPPETTPQGGLFMILLGVIIGTVLILLLVRFRRHNLWRVWFTLAAGMTMTVAFGAILGSTNYAIAAFIAFLLAAWKVFKPNPYVHNFTELFIYPGIAILFYHILNVPMMLVLLAAISLYDIIAVFRSKHMVSMAQFQTESKVFAGLAVPRGKPLSEAQIKKLKPSQIKKGGTAILGGGDVAFPLLFASVVMKELVMGGVTKAAALSLVSIIAVTTTIFLALLFFASEKGKFYPAMPAVSAGAILGWLIVLLF